MPIRHSNSLSREAVSVTIDTTTDEAMSAARDYEHVGVDEGAENESVDGSESYFTQSLKSSILQGVEENGRRYHRFCRSSLCRTRCLTP